MLGESEDDINELTISIEPEDGVFGVVDKLEGDNTSSLTVVTEEGIDNLRELILDMKRNGQWPPEKLRPKLTCGLRRRGTGLRQSSRRVSPRWRRAAPESPSPGR
jgi:hypothetical protein